MIVYCLFQLLKLASFHFWAFSPRIIWCLAYIRPTSSSPKIPFEYFISLIDFGLQQKYFIKPVVTCVCDVWKHMIGSAVYLGLHNSAATDCKQFARHEFCNFRKIRRRRKETNFLFMFLFLSYIEFYTIEMYIYQILCNMI